MGLAGEEWAWRLLGDLPWTEGVFAVIAWAGALLLGPVWGHLLGWLVGVVLGAVSLSWAASRLGSPMSPALLLMGVVGGAAGAGAASGRLDLLVLPGLSLLAVGLLGEGRRLVLVGGGLLLMAGGGLLPVVAALVALGLAAWWAGRPLLAPMLVAVPGLALAVQGQALPWAARGSAWSGLPELLGWNGAYGLGLFGIVGLGLAIRVRASRPLGLALALVSLLALGPTLAWAGFEPRLGTRGLALPGALLWGVPGVGLEASWSEAVVVVSPLLALTLARLRLARGWLLLLALLTLVEGVWTDAVPISPAPPVSLAVRTLADGSGGVLELPVRPPVDGRGQRAWHGRYLSHARIHGRPAPAAAPPSNPSAWAGEPLVLLALHSELAPQIPARAPGSVARAHGVETIVVHRVGIPESELFVLDALLRSLCGPAVRDLAAGVDLYTLPEGAREPASMRWRWEEARQVPGESRLDRAGYLRRWGGAIRPSPPEVPAE